EREKIYLAIRAVVRHIQPDAHVNTLLFELRREVRIGQWARSDRDVFGCPSFELEHATSHSKEFFLCKLTEHAIRSRERVRSSGNRQFRIASMRRAIVKENSLNFFLHGVCATEPNSL